MCPDVLNVSSMARARVPVPTTLTSDGTPIVPGWRIRGSGGLKRQETLQRTEEGLVIHVREQPW